MDRPGVIPCSCGSPYIGETGRSLQVRITEHKRAVRIGDPKNAISIHANSTGHAIDWNNSEVIAYKKSLPRWKFREAAIIHRTANNINTVSGSFIHPTWQPFFKSHSPVNADHTHCDDDCLVCQVQEV